jgi:hypothetical protein
MNRHWLAYGLTAIISITGIAVAVDASAQDSSAAKVAKPKAGTSKASSTKVSVKAKSAKRAPAKKAKAKSGAAAKVVVPTLVATGIEIAPGGNTIGAHAALYAAYANDVGTLAVRSVTSGAALTFSTEKIARHLNSDRLALGIIAYGASYAATHDPFVAEVRKAADYFGRDAFIAKLRREYSYARVLPGGEEAAQRAARAVLADSAKIQLQGDDFKQAAYDWQALTWAKRSTLDAKARNTALRALVAPPPAPSLTLTLSPLPEATISPETTMARGARISSASRLASDHNRTEIILAEPIRAWSPVDRMVSVAALMALGAPIDKKDDTEALMRDPRLVSCVNSARLNMQMCNAATRQPYERSFCLAQHPLGEIAACMAKVVR